MWKKLKILDFSHILIFSNTFLYNGELLGIVLLGIKLRDHLTTQQCRQDPPVPTRVANLLKTRLCDNLDSAFNCLGVVWIVLKDQRLLKGRQDDVIGQRHGQGWLCLLLPFPIYKVHIDCCLNVVQNNLEYSITPMCFLYYFWLPCQVINGPNHFVVKFYPIFK